MRNKFRSSPSNAKVEGAKKKKKMEQKLTTSVQGTEEGPQLPPGRRDSFSKTSSRKLLWPLSLS